MIPPVRSLVGRLVGLSAGRSVGRSVGRGVGRSVGRSVIVSGGSVTPMPFVKFNKHLQNTATPKYIALKLEVIGKMG